MIKEVEDVEKSFSGIVGGEFISVFIFLQKEGR
jgi:hypothetical protein